jgi:hypothetical protein
MCLSAESRPVNGGAGVKGTSAPVMWWHLIPYLAPVLTGQDRRRASTYRGVLWATCECTSESQSWRGKGHWTGAMQDATYVLPRIHLLRPSEKPQKRASLLAIRRLIAT